MEFDLIEIAKSWITAANPSEEQSQLARKRYQICLRCDKYRKSRPITHDEYCSACTCPISKKYFPINLMHVQTIIGYLPKMNMNQF